MIYWVQSGDITQYAYFVRQSGIPSSAFVVERSRDNSSFVAMTDPTVAEKGSTGVYTLLLDEDMTLTGDKELESLHYRITAPSVFMQEEHVDVQLYRVLPGTPDTAVATPGALAFTWEDIILHARELLQDSRTPYRFTDEQLVKTLNRGLMDVGRIRSDAFYTQYSSELLNVPKIIISGSPAADELLWTTNINLEGQFFPILVNYVVAVSELTDDEFTVDGRAIALLTQFHTALTGAV